MALRGRHLLSVEHLTIPVYALGGMQPELQETAQAHGAHGIALMRGW